MINSYDRTPYPRLAHFYSHPDRAAALAWLHGLTPPPVTQCRVLELGCASGSNLIPMALAYPNSEFIGLDLSARQIEMGQADVATLGLKNLTLKHLDLLAVDESFGQFDYILAHGVYSWVPPAVQAQVLTICRQNLSPAGLAYVSYNTYPGWHMLGAIRQMMLYRTRETADPAEKAEQARSLLDFLAGAVEPEGVYGALLNSHNTFLKKELAHLQDNAYLLHDHLEEVNAPVYFHEFVERAEASGLQYLCDADFRTAVPSNLPPRVAEGIAHMAHDLTEFEQYMDFVRNRTFRQSLLCHAEAEPGRTLRPERLWQLQVASAAWPVAEAMDLRGSTVEQFRGHDGATLSVDHPLSKAALLLLARRWPECVPFPRLAREAAALLQSSAGTTGQFTPPIELPVVPQQDLVVLGANLLKAFVYSESIVEFHTSAPVFTTRVSERPTASAWARYQTRFGQSVTNFRHQRVNLDPYCFHLLRLLDGTRDRPALLTALEAAVAQGELVPLREDQPISNPAEALPIVRSTLEAKLTELARAALLVPSQKV